MTHTVEYLHTSENSTAIVLFFYLSVLYIFLNRNALFNTIPITGKSRNSCAPTIIGKVGCHYLRPITSWEEKCK